MTIANVGALIEALRRNRLLQPAQLDEVARKLSPRYSDPRTLAKDLVKRGWLTPQQVNLLFTGQPPLAVAAPALPQAMAMPAYAPPAPAAAPSYRRRRRSPFRWLLLNVVGLAVIAGLGTLLFQAYKYQKGLGPDTEAERQRLAQAELEGLQARLTDKPEEQGRWRSELLAFRKRYLGTPQVVVAGELLSQLSSPLDALEPNLMPEDAKLSKPPGRTVAVFGESRSRHWGPARFVIYGDASKYISLGDDRSIRFWNSASGKEAIEPLPVASGSTILAFGISDDRKAILAATADGEVLSWDTGTLEQSTHKGPVKKATAAAVAPNGKIAATAGEDNKVRLWEVASGKEIATADNHSEKVLALVFSANSKLLASGGADKLAFVIDTESGTAQKQFSGHSGAIRCLAFARDGKTLASGSDDFNIKLWDVDSGKEKISYEEHQGSVTAVAFSPDGKHLASGSVDRTVRLWEPSNPENRKSHAGNGHADRVRSVAFSLDGKTVASAGNDGTVRMWDALDARVLEPLKEHTGPVLSVALSPDCVHAASASRDRTAIVWDMPERKAKETLKSFEQAVGAVAFNLRGDKLAAGDYNRKVRLWDMPGVKEKGSLAGEHIGPVLSLAYGADDQTLVIGAGDNSNNNPVGQVRVLDFEQSAERFDKNEYHAVVGSVAVSPSNKLLAAGYWDGTIKVWDFDTGTERFSLSDPSGVNSVAFSADSKTLASGGPGDAIKLWDITTGKERQSLKTDAGETMGLAFSADGKRLASVHNDGRLLLWDAASGKLVEKIQLPGAINSVAFAIDSRHVATGNSNGTVYVFRLAKYQPRKKDTGKATEPMDGN